MLPNYDKVNPTSPFLYIPPSPGLGLDGQSIRSLDVNDLRLVAYGLGLVFFCIFFFFFGGGAWGLGCRVFGFEVYRNLDG